MLEDFALFSSIDDFEESKCFQNLLLLYESKHGSQALESLQRDLTVSSQELKSKIVSVVRTDFDALSNAPLEMMKLDDCVQLIESKAQDLHTFSAASFDRLNVVQSNIDCTIEDFRRCHAQRLHADAELQRVLWLHELGTALSCHSFVNHPEMDQDCADELAAGTCLHLCVLAHAVAGAGSNYVSCSCEVEAAAAAAIIAVQSLVLPRIQDALHRHHRLPGYVRCLCLVARKDIVLTTISNAITHPIISGIFSHAALLPNSAAALMQLFIILEKELCQLLQLFQRPKLLLPDDEIDVSVDLLLSPFFNRLLKSEYCTDFVQVDTVADRYFAYMKGLQHLAGSSVCNDNDAMRAFLLEQHACSSAAWALPLRALHQV
jgi:hypothetical protein